MALFLSIGLDLPAMLLFQAPIAHYWLSRKEGMAVSMLFCATVIPVIVTGSLVYGLIFGVMASYGLLLGVLARRQVSLGKTITLLTLALFALFAAWSAADWSVFNADMQAAFRAYVETLESANTEQATEQLAVLTDAFDWIKTNLAFVYFGALLSGVMLMVTALCVPVYWRFRSDAAFSAANCQFRLLRTPEHLVWFGILFAGLWFLDSRWPNDVLRLVSWNGALALATVYWINGLSILFYVSNAWKWRPFVLYMLLLCMFLVNIIFALSIVGFFDTWFDFRRKVSHIIELQKSKDRSDSDS